MWFCVTWGTEDEHAWLRSAMYRYGLLTRLRRCAARQGATLVAFGFSGPLVRLVIDARDARSLSYMLRGLRIGVSWEARNWGVPLGTVVNQRERAVEGDVLEAVVWAHSAPLGEELIRPLESTWTSHRDLMGLREMLEFDATPLRAAVDAAEVHRRLGGASLPAETPGPHHRPSLFDVLRVSAAVVGVLPDDHRCFRLFVHLAKHLGFDTGSIADTLDRTRRRIRQLRAQPEPLWALGAQYLVDERLCRIP